MDIAEKIKTAVEQDVIVYDNQAPDETITKRLIWLMKNISENHRPKNFKPFKLEYIYIPSDVYTDFLNHDIRECACAFWLYGICILHLASLDGERESIAVKEFLKDGKTSMPMYYHSLILGVGSNGEVLLGSTNNKIGKWNGQ